jgi:hypothetical protein
VATEAGGPTADQEINEDLTEVLRRALRPFFTTVGEAFGVIEDRQVAMEEALGDIGHRLDLLRPAWNAPRRFRWASCRPPSAASRAPSPTSETS